MTYGDGEDERPTRRHPTRRMSPRSADSSASGADPDRGRDPVRSKILYSGIVALVAAIVIAIGLAALFDISFWPALGITALIGLGLAMLLAVLVG